MSALVLLDPSVASSSPDCTELLSHPQTPQGKGRDRVSFGWSLLPLQSQGVAVASLPLQSSYLEEVMRVLSALFLCGWGSLSTAGMRIIHPCPCKHWRIRFRVPQSIKAMVLVKTGQGGRGTGRGAAACRDDEELHQRKFNFLSKALPYIHIHVCKLQLYIHICTLAKPGTSGLMYQPGTSGFLLSAKPQCPQEQVLSWTGKTSFHTPPPNGCELSVPSAQGVSFLCRVCGGQVTLLFISV